MTQNATNSFDGEHSQEPSPTPAQIQQMVQVGMDAAKLLGRDRPRR